MLGLASLIQDFYGFGFRDFGNFHKFKWRIQMKSNK